MEEQTRENPYVRYIMYPEERLLYAHFKENKVITLQEAKKIIEDRLAIQEEGKKYVLLITTTGSGPLKITKEARDYFAKQEKGITAHAICTNSTFEKMMACFYLTFSKPVVPAKSFCNPQNAIKWLKEMQEKLE